MKAQRLDSADGDVRRFVAHAAGAVGEALGDNLVGIYLYGSLASGAFHRAHSDIDFFVVVEHDLSAAQMQVLDTVVEALNRARPSAGELEVAWVSRADAREFPYPIPRAGLGAQMLYAQQQGVRIVGPPIESVFGPVPWFAFMDAVIGGFERQRSSKDARGAVLSACRTLHDIRSKEMRAISKEEAARWSLQHAPARFSQVIQTALDAQHGATHADYSMLAEFLDYVGEQLAPIYEKVREE